LDDRSQLPTARERSPRDGCDIGLSA
jgi:hypothetical protein